MMESVLGVVRVGALREPEFRSTPFAATLTGLFRSKASGAVRRTFLGARAPVSSGHLAARCARTYLSAAPSAKPMMPVSDRPDSFDELATNVTAPFRYMRPGSWPPGPLLLAWHNSSAYGLVHHDANVLQCVAPAIVPGEDASRIRRARIATEKWRTRRKRDERVRNHTHVGKDATTTKQLSCCRAVIAVTFTCRRPVQRSGNGRWHRRAQNEWRPL
jgi:hypothetical protein